MVGEADASVNRRLAAGVGGARPASLPVLDGGEGGIRTHGAHRTPLFESGTLNHSDTSPRRASLSKPIHGGGSAVGQATGRPRLRRGVLAASEGGGLARQTEADSRVSRRASLSLTPEITASWWPRAGSRASWMTLPAAPFASSGT